MKKTVLIIDSDANFCNEIQTRLSTLDFEVKTALSGKEGLSQAEQIQPNLILFSAEQRDMNGFILCKMLRNRVSSSVKLFLISAEASEEDLKKHRNSSGKADGYFQKPLDPQLFLTELNHWSNRLLTLQDWQKASPKNTSSPLTSSLQEELQQVKTKLQDAQTALRQEMDQKIQAEELVSLTSQELERIKNNYQNQKKELRDNQKMLADAQYQIRDYRTALYDQERKRKNKISIHEGLKKQNASLETDLSHTALEKDNLLRKQKEDNLTINNQKKSLDNLEEIIQRLTSKLYEAEQKHSLLEAQEIEKDQNYNFTLEENRRLTKELSQKNSSNMAIATLTEQENLADQLKNEQVLLQQKLTEENQVRAALETKYQETKDELQSKHKQLSEIKNRHEDVRQKLCSKESQYKHANDALQTCREQNKILSTSLEATQKKFKHTLELLQQENSKAHIGLNQSTLKAKTLEDDLNQKEKQLELKENEIQMLSLKRKEIEKKLIDTLDAQHSNQQAVNAQVGELKYLLVKEQERCRGLELTIKSIQKKEQEYYEITTELELKLNKALDEVRRWRTTSDLSKKEINRLNQLLNDLEISNKANESRIQSQMASASQKEKKLQINLNEALEAKETAVSKQIQEKNNLRAEYHSKEKKSQVQISKYKNKLSEQKNTIFDLNKKAKEKEESHKNLIDALKNEFQKKQNSLIQKYEKEQDEVRTESQEKLIGLTKSLEEAQKELKNKSAEIVHLQGQNNRLENEQKQTSETQNQRIRDLEQQFHSKCKSLQRQKESNDQLQHLISSFEQRLTALKSDKEKAILELKKDYKKNMEREYNTNQEARAQINELNKQIDKLSEYKTRCYSLERDFENLKTKKDALLRRFNNAIHILESGLHELQATTTELDFNPQ